MALMGAFMFADKSGDAVQLLYLPLLRDLRKAGEYSWGSATLAYLYRQLCRACQLSARELGGPLILMQLWSWEHIHIGRPDITSVRLPAPNEDQAVQEDLDDPMLIGSQHHRGVDPLACR